MIRVNLLMFILMRYKMNEVFHQAAAKAHTFFQATFLQNQSFNTRYKELRYNRLYLNAGQRKINTFVFKQAGETVILKMNDDLGEMNDDK